MLSRRRFAQSVAAAGLMSAMPGWSSPALPAGERVRFSCMLWALERQASFDQSVGIVADAGYQGIELTGQFQQWSVDERKRVMAMLRAHNLVIDSMSGVKQGFAVQADTEAFLAGFKEHLNFARELQCGQVILLSGKKDGALAPIAQRGVAIDNLKRAAELAAAQQVEIVIEPIDLLENPGIFLATVADAFEMVKLAGAPNLKVLYDIYHEQRSFGNLMEKLESNVGLIGLIHVANVPGRHEPSRGEINYDAIYQKLGELRYDRWMAMEYYPTSDPVESLRRARTDAQQQMKRPSSESR